MIGVTDLFQITNLLPLAQHRGSFWMPERATENPEVDPVFYLILGICAFFFLLVVGLMGFFVIRYRRRPGVSPEKSPSHNTSLEIFWTIIPVIVVSVVFYQGFTAYMDMQTAPPGCYEIRVTAQKWAWLFEYPNGHVNSVLHVPIDEPVKLIMTSEDVIHSLWIPALRRKMDVVPGRYTSAWFRAVRPGTYQLLCTEYCGTGHSDMISSVVVHPPGKFEKWLEDADNYLDTLPPAEAGEQVYTNRGCAQCHTIDNGKTVDTGPPFWGIFGETHKMANGDMVEVDDNHIRESILDPQAKIRDGYRGEMPTYQGRISDKEITALIEFIKTLK